MNARATALIPQLASGIICIALLAGFTMPALPAQEALQVRKARCDTCRIEVSRLLTFGAADGPGIIEDLDSWVRRGPDGQYLVVARAGSAHAVNVFDSLGRFRQRVGRRGQGPQEFQDIVQIQVLDDGDVAVFDRLNMRLSVWSPAFSLIETRPVRAMLGYSSFLLPDGSVLTNGRQPTPDFVGRPVTLINASGTPVRAFDAHDEPDLATDEDRVARRLAMSGDTAFWSAHVDRYEAHLWHLDGRLLTTLQGTTGWFTHDPGPVPAGGPSPSRLLNLWEEDGVLWMLVAVPDEDWTAAVTPSDQRRGYDIDDYRGYRDTMLHAVDVRTGEALGTARLDDPVFNFVDGAHLALIEEDQGLIPRVVILRFGLVR